MWNQSDDSQFKKHSHFTAFLHASLNPLHSTVVLQSNQPDCVSGRGAVFPETNQWIIKMIFHFKKVKKKKKSPHSVVLKTHEPTKCGGKEKCFFCRLCLQNLLLQVLFNPALKSKKESNQVKPVTQEQRTGLKQSYCAFSFSFFWKNAFPPQSTKSWAPRLFPPAVQMHVSGTQHIYSAICKKSKKKNDKG